MNNPATLVYSEAFFQLSKEKNKLDEHKENLYEILDVIKQHEEISGILNNPNVLKEDKKQLISKIFGHIEIESLNLIKVLIDKSRFDIFEDLVRDYKKRYNTEKNIVEGIVYSAYKLDLNDIKDLEKVLEKKLDKKVELDNEIDNSLIGGVSIYVDGKRIDNSIKYRLDSLKSSIKGRR